MFSQIWTIISVIVAVRTLPTNKIHFNAGEPLLLSPLIGAGKIKEAQKLAFVENLEPKHFSYSGFLTVNETCNSNMFFWFFPSQNNAGSDPIAVWLNGGPGSSSLVGLFKENGPYRLTVEGNLTVNEFSWNRNSSVLYVDNPVGAGFSYTDSLDCYCTNEMQVAANFLEFLNQFFLLFPNMKSNKFFLTGQSYAGKYIPAIAYAIFTQKADLRLDGIAIGNGLIDPINQLHYAEHFYQLGLADERIKKEMEKAEFKARELIAAGNYSDAVEKREEMIRVVFGNKAGYTDFYNYLYPNGGSKVNLRKFLNKTSVSFCLNSTAD